MKEANYSTGDYYHYTYDAVGNRLTQQTSLATTNYAYDNANRLTTVGSVSYTWDNNGNLLNDGVNTYAYDSANRLTAVSGQQSATYGYNGLGDRLTQNGVNYTLDLNTGLTQVLNDGTNQYLYGLGRIAQVNTTTEYFLGDALGSVRQLTNATGDVTLAKSYQPYGEVMSSAGSATTPFAYTGEQVDSSGLVYLRARYYHPNAGRFTSRDTWGGNTNSPITFNRWVYGNANPVMFTDPSGHCIFGFDTVFCIAVLVGVPFIAGITTASWDYYVTQGHGVGGANEFNSNCVDWGQVFGAGKYGTFGAIEPFVMLPASIPLTPSYLLGYFKYGMTPAEVNEFFINQVGLGNVHSTAMQNPYYVSGRAGGSIGSLALSLHMALGGLPTLNVSLGAPLSGYNQYFTKA